MEDSARLAKAAVAGTVLADIADGDKRIVVLTADLKYSNRTSDFEARHPGRFLNVGIAEQHMVSMAAGLATTGYIPYVATFASFAGLLCVEQIRTDLAYPGLPVRVLAHHAGISLGFYGTPHHATEDLATTRSIANLTVVCPCDAESTRSFLVQTRDYPGPIYFRLGRGREPDVYTTDSASRLVVGKVTRLRDGDDIALVCNGITVSAGLDAAEQLSAVGVEATVVDAHTARPFDAAGICAIAERTQHLLVVEEHNAYGGIGTACADAIVDGQVPNVRLGRLGLPADEYALIGPPTHLYRHYGLDAAGIVKAARELLSTKTPL
jgi:transketolase